MNHNQGVPDFELGDVLLADVLKKLNELLGRMQQAEADNQGSNCQFVYVAKGAQYVNNQYISGNQVPAPVMPQTEVVEESPQDGDSDEGKDEFNNSDDLVTKLKPIFFNNEEDVRLFLKEIDGMREKDITDLVNKWVNDKRISDFGNSRKGVLWTILNEAGLYNKSKQNWNRRVF